MNQGKRLPSRPGRGLLGKKLRKRGIDVEHNAISIDDSGDVVRVLDQRLETCDLLLSSRCRGALGQRLGQHGKCSWQFANLPTWCRQRRDLHELEKPTEGEQRH